MERLHSAYSTKNIPIPTKEEYKIQLISKVESVLKRTYWKAQQFLRKLESSNKETYGFHSRKCPQTNDELIGSQDDLMSLIKTIEFRNVSNTFQEQMENNITQRTCTNKVIVLAGKTCNLYNVEKEDYKKYLRDNITKTYKKLANSKVKTVNLDPKKIADKLLISDRVDQLQKHDAYITVKDHKESFPHNPSFRLINPSKPDSGKVSKTILDRMNKEITSSIQVN